MRRIEAIRSPQGGYLCILSVKKTEGFISKTSKALLPGKDNYHAGKMYPSGSTTERQIKVLEHAQAFQIYQ